MFLRRGEENEDTHAKVPRGAVSPSNVSGKALAAGGTTKDNRHLKRETTYVRPNQRNVKRNTPAASAGQRLAAHIASRREPLRPASRLYGPRPEVYAGTSFVAPRSALLLARFPLCQPVGLK
jgi:hypothetical protein